MPAQRDITGIKKLPVIYHLKRLALTKSTLEKCCASRPAWSSEIEASYRSGNSTWAGVVAEEAKCTACKHTRVFRMKEIFVLQKNMALKLQLTLYRGRVGVNKFTLRARWWDSVKVGTSSLSDKARFPTCHSFFDSLSIS